MGLGKRVIQFERLTSGFLCQQLRLPRSDADLIAGNYIVGLRQPGIGEGIVGICGNGLMEKVDALLESFRRAAIPELAGFQIEAVGFRIGGTGAT